MKKSIQYLNTLRFLTLLFSLIGLGCHFAQCTLLNVYQDKVSRSTTIVICIMSNLIWNRQIYQAGLQLVIGKYVKCFDIFAINFL